MDSPIVLSNYHEYEVKIKEKDSKTAWEDLKPTSILHSSDDWQDALKSYVHMLKSEHVDISNVWEFRINHKGSYQGHYYNPTWQGELE